MREEKIARSISAALIVLPIAFIPLCLIWGFEFARTALFYGMGCTAVGIAAGWFLGRKHAALQILAAALPAAVLALAVTIPAPGADVLRYSMMGLGALLAVWMERRSIAPADTALRSGLLLAPLISLLIVSIFLWATGRTTSSEASQAWTLIVVFGAVWFAAAVVLMNRLSLRQAAHAGSHSDVPSGARRSGTVGALVFIVATLLLSGISTIVQGLIAFFKAAAYWLIQAFIFLMSLLPGGGDGKQPQASSAPDMLPKDTSKSSPLMDLITNIIIAVVLVAVVAAICYGLTKLFPKLWKKLKGWLSRLFATWHDDEAGYQDRAESLMTLRQALAGAGERLARLARRFRRKPRIGDFNTNSGKVRFLFREFLHNLVSSGHEPPPGATATDIARPAPSLAKAYNLARYGEEEPSSKDIEKAEEAVKHKE